MPDLRLLKENGGAKKASPGLDRIQHNTQIPPGDTDLVPKFRPAVQDGHSTHLINI